MDIWFVLILLMVGGLIAAIVFVAVVVAMITPDKHSPEYKYSKRMKEQERIDRYKDKLKKEGRKY